MRNIGEVIDRMMHVIPEDQTAFREDIQKVVNEIGYTAPERIHDLWKAMARIIWEHMGGKDPDELTGWQRHAVKIWLDKTLPSCPTMDPDYKARLGQAGILFEDHCDRCGKQTYMCQCGPKPTT